MKKELLLAGLLAATATVANAQSNVVKVNILSPIFKTGSFFYERKLSDDSSIQLGALFTSASVSGTDISGFAITPEYRFYLSERSAAPQGFYVGPFLRYQNLTLEDTYNSSDNNGNPAVYTDKASLNTFGGGVVVGRHWIFKERFSLDVFLGPSYNSGNLKVESTNNGYSNNDFDTGSFEGFGLRAGVTFGIAF